MARSFLYGLTRLLPRRFRRHAALVPVVRLTGIIGYTTPLMPGMTLASVARALERAFSIKHAKAVALVINSPGGSAAQSHLIHTRIRALAAEHKRPVIAFVEDVAASGGYMIASAADEIVADASSIVGSIGVVSTSFGFDRLIERIGIERRVHAAGERKVILDPFQPEKREDVARLKALQKDIHELFISLVKARRGKKLKGPEKALFSGEFWLAGKALELGLVDQIGELRGSLRERFGDKVTIQLISPPASWFGRRAPGIATEAAQGDWAATLISAIEARALWARYGL
ncbi:MAG: S49 family peptidase [Xanthobacteraceae bacterium]|nr:S49 family peptidase [Xanthobacteraceae bacterium]